MKKLKPWLFLAVIFLAGAVAGSALTIHFFHPRPPDRQQMKEMLTRRLNLTPDQQIKIDPILTAAGTKLEAVHHDEMDQVSKIFEDSSRQLAAILTPDQQAELARMNQERHRMFPGHHHPWGPPPGGPDDHGPEPPPPGSP